MSPHPERTPHLQLSTSLYSSCSDFVLSVLAQFQGPKPTGMTDVQSLMCLIERRSKCSSITVHHPEIWGNCCFCSWFFLMSQFYLSWQLAPRMCLEKFALFSLPLPGRLSVYLSALPTDVLLTQFLSHSFVLHTLRNVSGLLFKQKTFLWMRNKQWRQFFPTDSVITMFSNLQYLAFKIVIYKIIKYK